MLVRDPITKGQERMFLGLTPHATFIPIKGAGHFLQVGMDRFHFFLNDRWSLWKRRRKNENETIVLKTIVF